MRITIDRIDHIVINCRHPENTAAWYERVLGMEKEELGPDRHTVLKFGNEMLRIRPTGAQDWWSVEMDVPGSLDLCFITRTPISDVVRRLEDCGVTIVKGPVKQFGALGPMTSVYCHDPDENLVEIAVYS